MRMSSLARRSAGLLVALEPVVRKRLPARQGAHPDVAGGPALERVVDCAEADARAVRVGAAAAEQGRAAEPAGRLRSSLCRPGGSAKFLSGDGRDSISRAAAVRRSKS